MPPKLPRLRATGLLSTRLIQPLQSHWTTIRTMSNYNQVDESGYEPKEKDPQIGDYPNLPWVNKQLRTPIGWWDNQERRNYGEPVS